MGEVGLEVYDNMDSFNFFIYFCSAGDQTQNLLHAKQILRPPSYIQSKHSAIQATSPAWTVPALMIIEGMENS